MKYIIEPKKENYKGYCHGTDDCPNYCSHCAAEYAAKFHDDKN